jgi:hypothetical protein
MKQSTKARLTLTSHSYPPPKQKHSQTTPQSFPKTLTQNPSAKPTQNPSNLPPPSFRTHLSNIICCITYTTLHYTINIMNYVLLFKFSIQKNQQYIIYYNPHAIYHKSCIASFLLMYCTRYTIYSILQITCHSYKPYTMNCSQTIANWRHTVSYILYATYDLLHSI